MQNRELGRALIGDGVRAIGPMAFSNLHIDDLYLPDCLGHVSPDAFIYTSMDHAEVPRSLSLSVRRRMDVRIMNVRRPDGTFIMPVADAVGSYEDRTVIRNRRRYRIDSVTYTCMGTYHPKTDVIRIRLDENAPALECGCRPGWQDITDIVATPDESRELLDALASVQAMSWRGRYEDFSVLDGSEWELEMVVDSKRRKCSGYMLFPPRFFELADLLEAIADRHRGIKRPE